MKEEKLKQLKMALTDHKTIIAKLGENRLLLKWDDQISNYRGYSKELNLEIGIWDLTYLIQVANGKDKNVNLEVIHE